MRILVKGLRSDITEVQKRETRVHKKTQNVVTYSYCSTCLTYTGTYLKRKNEKRK